MAIEATLTIQLLLRFLSKDESRDDDCEVGIAPPPEDNDLWCPNTGPPCVIVATLLL